MVKKAWQLEKEFRQTALPVDRRVVPAQWDHV